MNKHPFSILSDAQKNLLQSAIVSSEKAGKLDVSILNEAFSNGWFAVFNTENKKGKSWSLPEVVRLEEELAFIDGSISWTITLCSGAGWFAGFVQEDTRKEFFAPANAIIAGSGAATGTAEITATGYLVNGYWKYATGALHATAFTANCEVPGKEGPEIRSFIFKRAEVILHETWRSMGMAATGSHSFSVKNLEVPFHRSFKIAAEYAVVAHPLYRYPFLQLAETTLAANLSGMALHFLEICEEVFSAENYASKHGSDFVEKVQQKRIAAEERLNKRRADFYMALESSWEAVEQAGSISSALLSEVSSSSILLAECARNSVLDLFPYGGLSFADTTTSANRVWRDLNTAAQHGLLVR